MKGKTIVFRRLLASVVSLVIAVTMLCGIIPGEVLTLHAAGTTVDLASLNANYTAQDGDVLTGTLAADHEISIADGATVTLKDAIIRKVGDGNTNYAGITCLGNATIVIEGDNVVKGFYNRYPGIYVSYGKTLTIKGTGILTAEGGSSACGIGGGFYNCPNSGNIVINGGTIIATGGSGNPGIGHTEM